MYLPAPGAEDARWNCRSGNLVIMPTADGLLRQYYRSCRVGNVDKAAVWFFTDAAANGGIYAGSSSEGTGLLMFLLEVGLLVVLDEGIPIPPTNTQDAHTVFISQDLWQPHLFLALLSRESLKRTISEARRQLQQNL